MASRRFLAAPFVVTVAAGCHGGAEAPISHNPPELTSPVGPATASTAPVAPPVPSATAATVTPTATSTATPPAPPPAMPKAGLSTTAGSWTVKKAGDKCTVEVELDCSQFPCTSSKPKAYPCPPAAEFPATVRRWPGHIVCTVQTNRAMDCPPASSCNPPPANYVRVPCPD
ncbi:MAG: hypothetical protein HOO96_37860 [Polyangiaceae bacterium]|nr:hypothetical protein [Polyangiaceae bacterium]